MGLRETYRRLGRLKSHGVNHHVSCQFLSLSSQRPQAAINSPAALPLQRGNELGNNRSHKGRGRQRLQSLFSAHPVCTPWGYCEILPTKEPSLPAFSSNGEHRNWKGQEEPTPPEFTCVPPSAKREPKSRNKCPPKDPC